jgi:hypothetical protein
LWGAPIETFVLHGAVIAALVAATWGVFRLTLRGASTYLMWQRLQTYRRLRATPARSGGSWRVERSLLPTGPREVLAEGVTGERVVLKELKPARQSDAEALERSTCWGSCYGSASGTPRRPGGARRPTARWTRRQLGASSRRPACGFWTTVHNERLGDCSQTGSVEVPIAPGLTKISIRADDYGVLSYFDLQVKAI